jgi:hypothetical protein
VAVASGGRRIAIQADSYVDAKTLERGQHGAREEGAVGLHAHGYRGRDLSAEQRNHSGYPGCSGQQWLAAVQDHLNAAKIVSPDVLGDTPRSRLSYILGHSFGQVAPCLVRHLIDIAIRTR